MTPRLFRRRLMGQFAVAGCLALAVAAVWPLLSLLWDVWSQGHGSVTWHFLSSNPTRPLDADGGGIANAVVGSGITVLIGTAIGAPFGLLAGVYLAEVGRGRLAKVARTAADALAGVPSIVAGLFAYVLVVTHYHYSAWAAGVALSVLVVPVVTRTTEEALRTVPTHAREAALALGAPHWYTVLRVAIPQAWGGIVTGLLLSVARVAGETAPILLTSSPSRFFVTDPAKGMATLPTVIYAYGKSAYARDNAQAWGAALVLIALVLALNLVVRLLSRRRLPSA